MADMQEAEAAPAGTEHVPGGHHEGGGHAVSGGGGGAAGTSAGGPTSQRPAFPKGLRVLVVDDDLLCLRVVETMLKKCDYEGKAVGIDAWLGAFINKLFVSSAATCKAHACCPGYLCSSTPYIRAVCTCATAASALEQLRDKTHNFDLVLSDVYMPGEWRCRCCALLLWGLTNSILFRQQPMVESRLFEPGFR